MRAGEARVSELRPNPLNPRGAVSPIDPKVLELAASIRTQGILQALLITHGNVIVAGHRRHVAARLVQLETVPITFKPMTAAEQLAAMLVENIQRDDLTPVQAARGCRDLRDGGMPLPEIAEKLGLAQGTVRRYLQLITLPARVIEAFDQHTAALGYIDVLVKLPPELQLTMGLRAIKQNWLVPELAKNAKLALGGGVERDRPDAKPDPQVKMPPERFLALLREAENGLARHPALVRRADVQAEIKRFAVVPKDAERTRS